LANRFLLRVGTILLMMLATSSLWSQNSAATQRFDAWKLKKVVDGSNTPAGPFREAAAISLDSGDNVFVVDRGLNRVVKFSPDGVFKEDIGGFGDGPDQLNDPRDVDAHLTLNVYVADFNNNRIVRYDNNLNFLNEFETGPDDPYYFEMPLSVAVSQQYDMFILEDLDKSVIKLNRFGQAVGEFGNASENLGQLLGPHQLAISEHNKIYVSDPVKQAIVVFDYLGNFLQEIIHPDFKQPMGISVSAQDDLVVSDKSGQRIYFFRKGQVFAGYFDLAKLKIEPVDAALWQPKGAVRPLLYVLSAQKYFIFESAD
jgi:hypothetical protein